MPLPAWLPDDKVGDPPKVANVIGENDRIVSKGGRANQQVMRADWSAGRGELRQ